MKPRFGKPKFGTRLPRYRNVAIFVAAVVTICVPVRSQTSENLASVDEILRSIKREAEVHCEDASGDAECGAETHQSRMRAHEPREEVSFQEFFEAYIDSLASNNAYDTVRFYADMSKSCYAKSTSGIWSRAELAAEHEKFLKTFSQRRFSNVTVHGATPLGSRAGESQLLDGLPLLRQNKAPAQTDVSIVVEMRNGSWQITVR